MATSTVDMAACQGWEEKNYQAVIRTFQNGHVEVATNVVRAMRQWERVEAWARSGPALPEGLSDKQLAQIEREKACFKARSEARKAERMEALTDSERERLEAMDKAQNIARAVRRARQQVRFRCHQLNVDHLVTLTYRENMEDVERLKRDWQEFVRLVKKAKPAWQYVACRERQDRGALHLHVAVRGRQDIALLRNCWYRALGGSGKETGEATPGQIDVRGPSKRFGSRTQDWKIQKLAGYMCKYLEKAFEELESKGSKRYWSSKGIPEPEKKKVWLGASCFVEAIIESHTLFKHYGLVTKTLWASDGYDCIWLAG